MASASHRDSLSQSQAVGCKCVRTVGDGGFVVGWRQPVRSAVGSAGVGGGVPKSTRKGGLTIHMETVNSSILKWAEVVYPRRGARVMSDRGWWKQTQVGELKMIVWHSLGVR